MQGFRYYECYREGKKEDRLKPSCIFNCPENVFIPTDRRRDVECQRRRYSSLIP